MLNLTVQSLDDVEKNVRIYVDKRKRAGDKALLHGIFGYLRAMEKYTFFGDYPLLHSTLVALKKIGMPVSRAKVLSCVNRRCKDFPMKFTGKKQIMEQLYETL